MKLKKRFNVKIQNITSQQQNQDKKHAGWQIKLTIFWQNNINK